MDWRDVLIVVSFLFAALTYFGITPKKIGQYTQTASVKLSKGTKFQKFYTGFAIAFSASGDSNALVIIGMKNKFSCILNPLLILRGICHIRDLFPDACLLGRNHEIRVTAQYLGRIPP